MTDYLTSRPYPARIHREQAPRWIASVMAALGIAPPPFARYLEIGCGPGDGVLHLAAAYPQMQFHGIDLNPRHIEAAKARAPANATFACADIASVTPLPYDFISCHGVYSWVGDDTRGAIRSAIARSLAPGGVALLHYMTAPGGSAFEAFHAVFRASMRDDDPVAAGLRRLVAMRDAGAGFFKLHPHASDTLDQLLREDPDYVAHEYLNPHFHALSVADVMTEMRAEGLKRIGSASGIDNIDAVSLPATCQNALATERDPIMREVLKDIARNQALRYDLFMRDPVVLDAPAHMALLRRQRFALLPAAPAPGALRFSTRIGIVDGEAAIFAPLLTRLGKGPTAFEDIERMQPFKGRPALLNQALQMLQWSGAAVPV